MYKEDYEGLHLHKQTKLLFKMNGNVPELVKCEIRDLQVYRLETCLNSKEMNIRDTMHTNL